MAGLLCCLLTGIATECAAAVSADAPLATVVATLRQASISERAAFVDAAVAELTAAYAAVVSDAERQGLPGDAGWITGTQAYMSHLDAIATSVKEGAAVQFLFARDGPLRVIVAGEPRRQFMLTSPRPHHRVDLERAVSARFCQRVGCASRSVTGVQVGTTDKVAGLRTAASTRGGDGLSCKHNDLRHGRLYRRACQQLSRELRLLAATLRECVHPIDWAIVGRPRRQGSDHVLSINSHGGAVVLSIPGLFQAPEVLADALPWIRALLAGKVARFQLEPPARLVYGTQVATR